MDCGAVGAGPGCGSVVVCVRFEVRLHGPLRVGTGVAEPGVDDTIDPDDPVPGSSLKGIMRAAARDVLAIDPGRITSVFGKAGEPSPWSWSTLVLGDHQIRPRSQVHIDPDTGTALERGLLTREQLEAEEGSFSIDPLVRSSDVPEWHRWLLSLAAEAVVSMGAARHRGLGWVTIRCVEWSPSVEPMDLTGEALEARLAGLRTPVNGR